MTDRLHFRPTNQVVPFLLYVSLSIPAAINSFLILSLDLGTEIAPALSFAWEAPEVSLTVPLGDFS